MAKLCLGREEEVWGDGLFLCVEIDKRKNVDCERWKKEMINPFKNKIWLSSPTMHGDELK